VDHRAIEYGVFDYIIKPFQADKLRFTVERAFKIIALKKELEALRCSVANGPAAEELVGKKSLKEATDELEKMMIEAALRKSDNIQTRASRLLKTTRRILRYKMETLGIE